MTKKKLQQLLQELQSRQLEKALLNDLHEGQKRFIFSKDDKGDLVRFVALLSARRFGKTSSVLMYSGSYCQSHPRARCVIIYQHRVDARDIAWPLLLELKDLYGWKGEFHSVELAFKFENGSIIKLYGADDPRKHRQFRGQRNDIVAIDEAQDFHSNLQQLIQWLTPGVADRRGRIFMLGTPGQVASGYFYEVVVERKHAHWAVVHGDPRENPHTAQQLDEQEEILRAGNPLVDQEPWFQREYRGRWVVDSRNNVCRVSPALNFLHRWEPHPRDRYLLGVDWGDQRAGFSIAVWNHDQYPWVVFLESETVYGGLITDHVKKIKAYQDKYKGLTIVADPGGVSKAIVRELEEVHGLSIQRADKEDRIAQIELMNTDLTCGLVKIYNVADPETPQNHELAREWANLTWVVNKNTGKAEEGRPRDLHDTALYIRRHCYKHWFDHNKVEPPKPGTEEHRLVEEKRIRSEIQKKLRKTQEQRGRL